MRQTFRVEGRVQGVGFRAWVYRRATELGLRGYARNEPDGSVTVAAEGPAEALDRLTHVLRRGPVLARVDQVQPIEAPADPLPPGFQITG